MRNSLNKDLGLRLLRQLLGTVAGHRTRMKTVGGALGRTWRLRKSGVEGASEKLGSQRALVDGISYEFS